MQRERARLEVTDLSVRYDGVVAVDGVSLAVDEGEIVGLIGPNGAGKSSFVDAVTGFTRYTGQIRLNGQTICGLAPHERSRAGLARTWQGLELFTDLTVAENVSVANRRLTWRSVLGDLVRPGRPKPEDRATAALETMGLHERADHEVHELSNGQRKMLGVARAVGSSSSIVLLDEPAAGLDSRESLELGDHLRVLATSGIGILLIEHDVDLVMSCCDRVYVLEFGRLIATGTAAEVRADPAVRTAYLGEVVEPRPELTDGGRA